MNSKKKRRQSFIQAFFTSIPVLLGYITIGIAFGLLINHAGYPWYFASLMSLFIYAGAAQFMAVGFLTGGASLIEVAMITLVVNARHMLYGLSLLTPFSKTSIFKPYLIFSLTDETYALLTSVKVPENTNPKYFYFFISCLNQFYWIAGSTAGAIIGSHLPFNTKGLDFALTALFVVLLIEQIKSGKSSLPFFISFGSAIFSLIIFGPDNMLIISLGLSIIILLLFRKRIKKNEHS